tara:strand:- start:17955 stop:18905 length:951 start_codon:yes stop_codon:yes gene_type:complete
VSYGLLNWWWGEEIKGPTDYLAKWWKHQRDTFLTDFKIKPDYEDNTYDKDYAISNDNEGRPYNPKDGRYLFWENDGAYCLILDRRFRFSDPKRPAQPHPEWETSYGIRSRHANLTQLGWGDAEIFTRLLGQDQLLEQDDAPITDFLMFCEDDEPYFQALLDPDSVLNTSFFPDKQAYQRFMRDNFIFVSPNAGRGNVKDTYYETFPELPQQQEKYEGLYEDIYGVDWEDRFDPDDLNTLLFFRPQLRNYLIGQFMMEFPEEMNWLLDGVIHSILTTPKDPEGLKKAGLIRTDFMNFLESAFRKQSIQDIKDTMKDP